MPLAWRSSVEEDSQGSGNTLDVLLSMASPLWERERCWLRASTGDLGGQGQR